MKLKSSISSIFLHAGKYLKVSPNVMSHTVPLLLTADTSGHNGITTNYVIDPIGFGNVAAEYDDSNNLIAYYKYGNGLLSREGATGTTAYYTFDAIGSTSEVTNNAGVALNIYNYDPFGISINKSENIDNPFEFVGQFGVMNELNGLEFMRARFYYPSQNRFLSEDPVGIIGGLHLYNYVNNSPINMVDPLGLKSFALGISGQAGASTGITTGWKTVWIPGKIPHLMFYSGGGSYIGIGASMGVDLEGTNATSYEQLTGWGMQMGGSGALVIGSIGGEYVGGNGYHGVNISIAASAPTPWGINGEGHAYATYTYDAGSVSQLFDIWYALNYYKNIIVPTKKISNSTGNKTLLLDPNKKTGPKGHGSSGFVRNDQLMAYEIEFENVPDATAPAHIIRVTDTLDEDLDLKTFEIIEISFADNTIKVPQGLNHYQTSVDLSEHGIDWVCQIEAGLDMDTRELTVTMVGIDPNTGWLPEDLMLGILYPNDDTGRGEGHISYLVKPKVGLKSGTQITNKATIYFDWNDPIETELTLNTIDVGIPASEVTVLPGETYSGDFVVSWTGQDDPNGSGVASYDIYVSIDGNDYALWLDDYEGTNSVFSGENGHTYAFYSIAADGVGYVEEPPLAPDATTTVTIVPGDVTADGLVDMADIAKLAQYWLQNEPSVDIAPDPNGDDIVNFLDFSIIAENW